MKKVKTIGLYLILGGSFLSFASPNLAHTNRSDAFEPMVFIPIEGKLWVEECVKQYPETLWLADRDVRKTEEGDPTLENTYSEQLFGQKYIEFDRTIMGLHSLPSLTRILVIRRTQDPTSETVTYPVQPFLIKLL